MHSIMSMQGCSLVPRLSLPKAGCKAELRNQEQTELKPAIIGHLSCRQHSFNYTSMESAMSLYILYIPLLLCVKEVHLQLNPVPIVCTFQSLQLPTTHLFSCGPSVPQGIPQHGPWTSPRLDHLNLHASFSLSDEGRPLPVRLVGLLPCHQHEFAIALVVEYNACIVII